MQVLCIQSLKQLPITFKAYASYTIYVSSTGPSQLRVRYKNFKEYWKNKNFDWINGHWLILFEDKFFWHKPNISYWRDKYLNDGYLPCGTINYTRGTTLGELFKVDIDPLNEVCRDNAVIKTPSMEITNKGNLTKLTANEILIQMPGLDRQRNLCWNERDCVGYYPKSFILLAS